MHNKTFTLLSLSIALLVALVHTTVNAQSFVTDNDRPDRAWMRHFDNADHSRTTKSIEDAIQQCPENQYCNVLIPTISIAQSINISRSRTRFIGMKDSTLSLQKSHNINGAIFAIAPGTTEVIFANLNIEGNAVERTPELFGISAFGSSISKVAIVGNSIHGLYATENAHAIAFYGTGKTDNEAIEHIVIQNNRVSDMRTGTSESIAINGNVRNWVISNNEISQINNIAIDAIGGEGTAPTQLLSDGRVAPGPFDAARYGFIEGNTVIGLSTKDNPAYGNQESWAAAIYIDGAHSIRVFGNTVSAVPWGIEVGAENCIRSSYVQIIANHSKHTQFGDILIGGYSKGGYLDEPNIDCDPRTSSDKHEGHGYVGKLDVRNNLLNGSKTNNQSFIGNTVLQYRVDQSTIAQPTTQLNSK